MRSYLDSIRKPVSLSLLSGEQILKYFTASYDIGSSLASSWRLGNLYLTNKRLLFVQGRKISFQILLNQIKTINIVKRRWILGKKVKQLNITSQARRVPYIAVKDPDGWKKAIEDRIQELQSPSSNPQPTDHDSQPQAPSEHDEVILKVDEQTLDKVASKLDAASRKILWFLYENRHARIDTLAKLIKASTHMDILLKIREIINPQAEKIIGYPILSFESSKVDWETGENVTFSWWLACQPQREEKEPLLDIFEEDAYLVVYLELLGLKEKELQLEVQKDKLIIDADKNYHKEILLPAVVNTNSFTKRYKNNILEVKIKK